jgi:hypothetical protein
MNERIKELAEQCGIKYGSSVNYFYSKSFDGVTYADLEKFAELIVRECALMAFHNVVNLSSIADAEDVEANIKQHLGVE